MQDHFFALHDTAEKLGKVSLGVFERRFHECDVRRRCARRQGHLCERRAVDLPEKMLARADAAARRSRSKSSGGEMADTYV